MVEQVTSPSGRRSRRLPVAAFLALTEAAAGAVLIGALFLPWFQVSNPGTIDPLPAGSFSMSYLDWHPSVGGYDNAQTLVGLGVYVSVGAVLLRIILRRGWTKVVLALGFLMALLGSVAAFNGMDSVLVLVPADSRIAPGIGMWVFGIAAAVGLVVATLDRVRASGPRSLDQKPAS